MRGRFSTAGWLFLAACSPAATSIGPLGPRRQARPEGGTLVEAKPRPSWAETAFRAGEAHRAQGRVERAIEEFRRAAASTGPFGCRARLEIGHIHRRAARHRDALDAYFELILGKRCAGAGEDCNARDHALLWAGRTFLAEGGEAAGSSAKRLWNACAAEAADPILRIRAADWTACLLVEEGDLEGAAGVLNLCRVKEGGAARAKTRHGERVQHALESMRSVALLAQAVGARWRDDPSTQVKVRAKKSRQTR